MCALPGQDDDGISEGSRDKGMKRVRMRRSTEDHRWLRVQRIIDGSGRVRMDVDEQRWMWASEDGWGATRRNEMHTQAQPRMIAEVWGEGCHGQVRCMRSEGAVICRITCSSAACSHGPSGVCQLGYRMAHRRRRGCMPPHLKLDFCSLHNNPYPSPTPFHCRNSNLA